jgi:hypothetical protein
MGGDFTLAGTATRHYIARSTNTEAAFQELKVSSTGSAVTWMRSGASPEVWRVTFEDSSDGITWNSLGNGTRITGGWQITGLALPLYQNHYVRARGYAPGGRGNGSESLYESVRMFYLNTPIIYVSTNGSCGGKDPCSSKIQDGIDQASTQSIIEITEETYAEDVVLDFNQKITLNGGWDTGFTSSSSYTTIIGSIMVTNGTMILENIILK